MEYRTDKDLKYYSSDLSKWIDENCTHEMTSINMDIVQYKRSLGLSRNIEYKHNNEGMKGGQEELLRIFSKDKPTYLIRGDYPFKEAKIKRISDGKTITVDDDELRMFLNFELIDIEDIIKYHETIFKKPFPSFPDFVCEE